MPPDHPQEAVISKLFFDIPKNRVFILLHIPDHPLDNQWVYVPAERIIENAKPQDLVLLEEFSEGRLRLTYKGVPFYCEVVHPKLRLAVASRFLFPLFVIR